MKLEPIEIIRSRCRKFQRIRVEKNTSEGFFRGMPFVQKKSVSKRNASETFDIKKM
jgi:hypothetical protein